VTIWRWRPRAPAAEFDPDDTIELLPLGSEVVLQARMEQAYAVLRHAFEHRRAGHWVPVEVLLDARNALYPQPRLQEVRLRPAVPYVPGPEGG
jgi:hypothetical protein